MDYFLVLDESILLERAKFDNLSNNDKVYLFSLTSQPKIISKIRELLNIRGVDTEILDVATLLNDAADRIRDNFIKFIAELPQKININGLNLKELFAIDKVTSLWWLSQICEKNTFKSDSFNRLAQLDSIIDAVKCKRIEKILFGCGCARLKNALLEYASRNSIYFKLLPIKATESLRRRIQNLQKIFYLKHILHLFYFSIKLFFRTRQIKGKLGNLRRPPATDDALMIITYYPQIDISLAKKGIFKNKYYPHLQESLENRGKDIVWIAMSVKNTFISFKKSLNYAKQFIKNGYTIFLLEEFNSFAIQLKAFCKILTNGFRFLKIEASISKTHTFSDYSFYQIFRDDWYSSFVGVVGYMGLIYYNIFKSLLSKFKVRKCLYYCEMHPWEKALAFAKVSTASKTNLIGYQHTTISKMLLNYFNQPSEVTGNGPYSIARPDKIICNGQVAFGYMKSSGWPQDKLAVAEAIRYTDLKQYMGLRWSKKGKIVLLVLSISPEADSAILNVTYESLKSSKDIEVWIRPHPFLQIEKVFGLSGISIKDSPFQVKNGPIQDLLSETRIVIAGESGVSIEALAFGCEVVNVNVPEWINMSPLRYVKTGIIRTVNSPEELRQTVTNIFKEEYQAQMHEAEAKRIINNYFCLNQHSDTPERLLRLLAGESA